MTLSNKITMARIALIPLFMVCMEMQLGLAAALVFGLAALTDYLDGYLARRRNEVTVLGKFLDPLADKLLTMAAFLYLVQLGILPAWAVVVILARETSVTGLRVLAARNGTVIAASGGGKIKTATQMVSLALLLLFLDGWLAGPAVWLAYGLFYFSLGAAVYSGIRYFSGSAVLFREPGGDGPDLV